MIQYICNPSTGEAAAEGSKFKARLNYTLLNLITKNKGVCSSVLKEYKLSIFIVQHPPPKIQHAHKIKRMRKGTTAYKSFQQYFQKVKK